MKTKQKTIKFEDKTIIINEGLTCPACGKNMNISHTLEDIPHFGKTQFIGYACTVCNYKSTELIPLESKSPVKLEFKVTTAKDLYVKVIRGQDTTIEIKEIGAILEPGSNPEAFYTNMEGLLNRFKTKVNSLEKYFNILKFEENSKGPNIDIKELKNIENSLKKITKISKKIDDYIESKAPFTVILTAENGMGAILSENVKKLKISKIKQNEEKTSNKKK